MLHSNISFTQISLSLKVTTVVALALSSPWLTDSVLAKGADVPAPEANELERRVDHARELLGKYYKRSVVRSTENIKSVDHFIFKTTQKELPARYRKKARALTKAIMTESKKHGFDPIFLLSVIGHESRFNPVAAGSFGEIGLMQIKPSTAEWICKKNKIKFKGTKSLEDPVTNVRIGAAFLAQLRGQFDSHSRLYIAAYNMGAKNVRSALEKQIWPKDYASAVMTQYVKFYTELSKGGDTKRALANI